MLALTRDPKLSKASVLVTGATGSFGRRFVETILRLPNGPARVVVFSRDELKQYEMSRLPGLAGDRRLRFFLGDVRDRDRLRRAFEGVDVVVHAAALKQVPAAEYNPFEFVKTNVLGAQNVIECALDMGVSRVVALSTDKAAAPVNLYGATKLCSDKLFVAANAFRGSHKIAFSVVRYGNVLGSRGSVVPYFLERRRDGVLPITDTRMTRFSLTIDEGVSFVLNTLAIMQGGEMFVPRLPSYRITDLAQAVAPDCRLEVVGVRPGEKLHEEMITTADSFRTAEFDDGYFVILPSTPAPDEAKFLARHRGRLVQEGFSYDSGNNDQWLSVDELRTLIAAHVPGAVVL
jgi:UDP-N-acetylglucosamine 4,6-dehydratase (inverting)